MPRFLFSIQRIETARVVLFLLPHKFNVFARGTLETPGCITGNARRASRDRAICEDKSPAIAPDNGSGIIRANTQNRVIANSLISMWHWPLRTCVCLLTSCRHSVACLCGKIREMGFRWRTSFITRLLTRPDSSFISYPGRKKKKEFSPIADSPDWFLSTAIKGGGGGGGAATGRERRRRRNTWIKRGWASLERDVIIVLRFEADSLTPSPPVATWQISAPSLLLCSTNFVRFSHSEALGHVGKSAGALLGHRSQLQALSCNDRTGRLSYRATALLAKRGDLPSALCLAPASLVLMLAGYSSARSARR